MAGVMPKVSIYLFLSIICLLINVSVFMTVVIGNETGEFDSFTGSSDYDLSPERGDDATVGDFVLTAGSSFVPFFSIVSLILYFDDLPIEVTAITTIIFLIISSVQVFLLAVIILNLVPKILGSGFDV